MARAGMAQEGQCQFPRLDRWGRGLSGSRQRRMSTAVAAAVAQFAAEHAADFSTRALTRPAGTAARIARGRRSPEHGPAAKVLAGDGAPSHRR